MRTQCLYNYIITSMNINTYFSFSRPNVKLVEIFLECKHSSYMYIFTLLNILIYVRDKKNGHVFLVISFHNFKTCNSYYHVEDICILIFSFVQKARKDKWHTIAIYNLLLWYIRLA